MRDADLVKVLHEHAEWARADEREMPITLAHEGPATDAGRGKIMKSDHIVEALTGDSGWRNMVPQVDSSDFPTQRVPSAYECSIIEAQAKEIEKLRAQASTVVHGRWIERRAPHAMGGISAKCSACSKSVQYLGNPLNYCPNCGAKMDGGADNACL